MFLNNRSTRAITAKISTAKATRVNMERLRSSSSSICDMVRLHKVEFEFVMPEMADTGMTVISSTVIANQGTSSAEAATLIPGSVPSGTNRDELDDDLPEEPDFDFDITGTADDSDAVDEVDEDEEDTVMREDMPAAEGSDGSEETIMLDDDGGDDIMDGYDDDDATIRPDQ